MSEDDMPGEGRNSRTDPLGRYYTSTSISALLVKAMRLRPTGTVLDLGAGDGALASEASRQWGRARFVTVDIDEDASCRTLEVRDGDRFRHHVGDALDYQLDQRLSLQLESACAAVCNPPYIRPRWQPHFGKILEEAGLSGVIPKLGDAPADLLFIAQNLRFLRKGGRLGLIVPDGLVSGERFEGFRSELLRRHRVHEVIELPISVFRGTEAKAHIFVLSKGPSPTESMRVRRLEGHAGLSAPIELDRERAIVRMDYSHQLTLGPGRNKVARASSPLFSLVDYVGRGSFSSSERMDLPYPVLHTSDLDADTRTVPARFTYSPRRKDASGGTVALAGDIVLARVGRNLHEKVAVVARGPVMPTDCLIILRPHKGQGERVLGFLRSTAGNRALAALSHGVGAKFITQQALGSLRVPIG
jgi:type I restriction enzyme M protein